LALLLIEKFRLRAGIDDPLKAEIAQLQNRSPQPSLHVTGIHDAKIPPIFDARGIPSAITVGLTGRAGKQ
jgi:hypothetical protein